MIKLTYPAELLSNLPTVGADLWRYAGWTFDGNWIAQGIARDTHPIPESYTTWALDTINRTPPSVFSRFHRSEKEGAISLCNDFSNRNILIPSALDQLITYYEDSVIFPVRIFPPGDTTRHKSMEAVGIFKEIITTCETVQEKQIVRSSYKLRSIIIP